MGDCFFSDCLSWFSLSSMKIVVMYGSRKGINLHDRLRASKSKGKKKRQIKKRLHRVHMFACSSFFSLLAVHICIDIYIRILTIRLKP